MSIKTKVTLGVGFLFVLILTIGGVGIFYLNSLARDSQNILVANYETLRYTKRIIQSCDSLDTDSVSAMRVLDRNLLEQERNITEPGELEYTHQLRVAYEKLKNSGIDLPAIKEVRRLALLIQDLNMQAIIRKNNEAQETAEKAKMYLIIMGTFCGLAGFIFIVNFPGYIANPIIRLTNGIKSIAEKRYEERLHFDRFDEFEELADAFNLMAEKLDEYEHSSLARILFEKKRIETIINRMTDPVIGLDENHRVVFGNDQALNLLNLTSHDIIGKYAPDIAVNNDLFRSLIRDSKDENASALIKIVVNGKDNFFSKESIAINHTSTGEKESVSIGRVILLKNITSYKELDQAKTNFIATISHELKTPIASLQMCSRLLLDKRVGQLNEEQTGILGTLNDEVIRLSKITNELLDLAQVETGNIKLSIRACDPAEIIGMALDAVRFQAERKHVKIDVINTAVSRIEADIDKTTWVIINLLTNAIRYSPENDTVVLRCSSTNGSVSFSVEDHGPGIEESYVNRIFEKFFQVPGTATGTGLGLAISKEFIDAQGGSIEVDSEVGRGSIFSFRLKKV